MEWSDTVPFVAVGVPAVPLGIASTITCLIKVLPFGRLTVCREVDGVIVVSITFVNVLEILGAEDK